MGTPRSAALAEGVALSRRHLRTLIHERESRRGLLIAFEGADGSGKSTQRKLLKRWLKSEGQHVVTSKWKSSRLIKPLIKSRKRLRALSPEEFSLLHAADYRHRLETDILPALWDGSVVLADRFLFTGLARDAARGLEFDWLLNVYRPLFWPDIVLYFAVSPETSTERIGIERAPNFYEAGQDITGIDDPFASYRRFISRIIREYESLALIFRFLTIDAEQPIYEQHQAIRELVQQTPRRPWADWNEEALFEWVARQSNGMVAC
jgi:dTMP kinase